MERRGRNGCQQRKLGRGGVMGVERARTNRRRSPGQRRRSVVPRRLPAVSASTHMDSLSVEMGGAI